MADEIGSPTAEAVDGLAKDGLNALWEQPLDERLWMSEDVFTMDPGSLVAGGWGPAPALDTASAVRQTLPSRNGDADIVMVPQQNAAGSTPVDTGAATALQPPPQQPQQPQQQQQTPQAERGGAPGNGAYAMRLSEQLLQQSGNPIAALYQQYQAIIAQQQQLLLSFHQLEMFKHHLLRSHNLPVPAPPPADALDAMAGAARMSLGGGGGGASAGDAPGAATWLTGGGACGGEGGLMVGGFGGAGGAAAAAQQQQQQLPALTGPTSPLFPPGGGGSAWGMGMMQLMAMQAMMGAGPGAGAHSPAEPAAMAAGAAWGLPPPVHLLPGGLPPSPLEQRQREALPPPAGLAAAGADNDLRHLRTQQHGGLLPSPMGAEPLLRRPSLPRPADAAGGAAAAAAAPPPPAGAPQQPLPLLTASPRQRESSTDATAVGGGATPFAAHLAQRTSSAPSPPTRVGVPGGAGASGTAAVKPEHLPPGPSRLAAMADGSSMDGGTHADGDVGLRASRWGNDRVGAAPAPPQERASKRRRVSLADGGSALSGDGAAVFADASRTGVDVAARAQVCSYDPPASSSGMGTTTYVPGGALGSSVGGVAGPSSGGHITSRHGARQQRTRQVGGDEDGDNAASGGAGASGGLGASGSGSNARQPDAARTRATEQRESTPQALERQRRQWMLSPEPPNLAAAAAGSGIASPSRLGAAAGASLRSALPRSEATGASGAAPRTQPEREDGGRAHAGGGDEHGGGGGGGGPGAMLSMGQLMAGLQALPLPPDGMMLDAPPGEAAGAAGPVPDDHAAGGGGGGGVRERGGAPYMGAGGGGRRQAGGDLHAPGGLQPPPLLSMWQQMAAGKQMAAAQMAAAAQGGMLPLQQAVWAQQAVAMAQQAAAAAAAQHAFSPGGLADACALTGGDTLGGSGVAGTGGVGGGGGSWGPLSPEQQLLLQVHGMLQRLPPAVRKKLRRALQSLADDALSRAGSGGASGCAARGGAGDKRGAKGGAAAVTSGGASASGSGSDAGPWARPPSPGGLSLAALRDALQTVLAPKGQRIALLPDSLDATLARATGDTSVRRCTPRQEAPPSGMVGTEDQPGGAAGEAAVGQLQLQPRPHTEVDLLLMPNPPLDCDGGDMLAT